MSAPKKDIEELRSLIADLKNLANRLQDVQTKIAKEEVSKIKRRSAWYDVKKKHKAR